MANAESTTVSWPIRRTYRLQTERSKHFAGAAARHDTAYVDWASAASVESAWLKSGMPSSIGKKSYARLTGD